MSPHHIILRPVMLNRDNAGIREMGQRRADAEHRLWRSIHQLGIRLSLAMLLLTTAVVIVGRSIQTTDSRASIGLDLCHRAPCFRGLTPGETAWTQADLAYDDPAIVFDPLRKQVAVSRSRDGVSIGTIYITLPRSAGETIGKIVALYGTPCKLTIVPKYQSLTIHYPRLHVTASFVNGQLNPDTPVQTIILSDPAVTSSACENPINTINAVAEITIYRRWQGFVSLRHYTDTANP